MKLYVADFRDMIAEQLHALGYRPSIYDPDFCMRPSIKPGGFMYYAYLICYVYGVLCIRDDPLCTIKLIQEKLNLKGTR